MPPGYGCGNTCEGVVRSIRGGGGAEKNQRAGGGPWFSLRWGKLEEESNVKKTGKTCGPRGIGGETTFVLKKKKKEKSGVRTERTPVVPRF